MISRYVSVSEKANGIVEQSALDFDRAKAINTDNTPRRNR
jgi:hypothetical protein